MTETETETKMADLPAHRIVGGGETTVFLLHGAYGSGDYFADLADSIAGAGYRVVVWHAPGYGGTELPAGITIPEYAERAAQLVRAVGTARNVVLGHSMGALIAPLATNSESRIDGLVLSAASAGFASRSPEDQKRYLDERLKPIEDGMTVQEYVQPLLRNMMGPGAAGPLVDRTIEVILEQTPTATFANSMRAISGYDGRPALAEVAVPTLLLSGTEDTACPPQGMQRMADMIPGSELVVFDGVGHYGFAEKPEAYAGALLDWLARRFPLAHGGAAQTSS